MRPVLFQIFGKNIYGYGMMITIGIITAVLILNKRGKIRGYDEDSLLNMEIFAVIAGVLGGKILYLLTDLKNIIADPSVLKDFGNGFVIYGAIIGGALAVYIYAKRKKWDILKIFDLAIPSVAIAQGIGRLGCTLAGCCYGKETTSKIYLEFTKSPFAPNHVHLFPTQPISAVYDVLLGLFLIWFARKNIKDGRVFGLYVIFYSVGRFIIEFFRGDEVRGFIGVLSTSQFISLFIVIVGVIFFNIHRFKKA
ncbi:MAG: prolipoprotein diacylglyceryl transferase [Clostridiaceae bacterium]